jgi:hypothetical protein
VVVHAAGGDATLADGFTATPNPPLAPTVPGPTALPYAAAVTWTAPADLGDGAITGIEVVLAHDYSPDVAAETVEVPATATTATFTDLSVLDRYVARVTYLSDTGRGDTAPSSTWVQAFADVGFFDGIPELVDQQYADFAGRAPAAAERTAAVDAIRTGAIRSTAWIASMRSRPEWSGARSPVTRLYLSYFRRLPDSGGLAHWAALLHAKRSTLAQISASFAGSSEFRRTYGSLSAPAFVDLVYRNVLGRPADAKGRAYWVAKLSKGASRGAVMASFSESAEHVRVTQPTVDAVLLYTGMLRRVPTTAELATPATVVATGSTGPGATASGTPVTATRTPAQIAAALLHSPAYADRF